MILGTYFLTKMVGDEVKQSFVDIEDANHAYDQ